MAEKTPKFGDEEFDKYIKESDKTDPLVLIINTIRYKTKTIYEFYSKSLDIYIKLDEKDPLKERIRDFLIKLIDHSLQSMDQFNYALIDNDDLDEEPSDESWYRSYCTTSHRS